MNLSACCMACLVNRQMENIRDCSDEAVKSDYMRRVLALIAGAPNEPAPVVIARLNRLHQDFFGAPYSFERLKEQYNRRLLDEEERLAGEIAGQEDPLLAALCLARAGNYIDFGAMGQVDDRKLCDLLDRAFSEPVDEKPYAALRRDLQRARGVCYLTDNCGEIVLDKLLIAQICRQYPQLEVTVVTRGMPVLNDATPQDALNVGLGRFARVIGNGGEIAGTYLPMLGGEALEAVEKADLIIAKGQGNFETLHGCGLNIYYLFLCKCDWFVTRFGLARFRGVFAQESRWTNVRDSGDF